MILYSCFLWLLFFFRKVTLILSVPCYCWGTLRWNPSSSQCALFICYSYIHRITLTLCFVLCLLKSNCLFVLPLQSITKLLEGITGFTQIAGFGIRLFRLELYWKMTDWRLFTKLRSVSESLHFSKRVCLYTVCMCLCPWQDFGWGLSWTSRAERMTDQLEEYDTSAVLLNTESSPHPHEFRGKCTMENLPP